MVVAASLIATYLGRLFASNHAEYGATFARNFKDYLSRFHDVSAIVRQEMVESGYLILQKKSSLRSIVEGSYLSMKPPHFFYVVIVSRHL
jgi:hypothetical protein